MFIRSLISKQNLPIIAGLTVGGAAAAIYLSRSVSTLRADAPGALSPDAFTPIPLASARYLSKDTKELVFDLPEDHTLGGKTSFMVLFKRLTEKGNPVIRPYTPVSTPETVGSATFVIKAYPGGKMSEYLHSLKDGDFVEVKGPIQKYLWEANKHKKIALLGGGTGITPLFQLLQTIADDPKDNTEVHLYYGNTSPSDVLLQNEIEQLVAKKPKQLKATFFVNKGDQNWKGETGFITKDYLAKNLFKPSDDNVKVFVCGPPPMYEALSGNKKSPSDQGPLTGALKDLGFTSEQVFKY